MAIKVLFLDPRPREVGSARIWIQDLSGYLGEIGIRTAVNDEAHLPEYDVVVLGKGFIDRARDFTDGGTQLSNDGSGS